MTGLNEQMEFDRVIYVDADGNVTYADDVYGPGMVYLDLDEEGQQIGPDPLAWEGWRLLAGYTGQYGAGSRSTVMHPSEYIGGRMARDILATPGYYVALVVDGLPMDEDGETESIGWAVGYREA